MEQALENSHYKKTNLKPLQNSVCTDRKGPESAETIKLTMLEYAQGCKFTPENEGQNSRKSPGYEETVRFLVRNKAHINTKSADHPNAVVIYKEQTGILVVNVK